MTNQKSYDNIEKWLKEIDTFAGQHVQKLLVGNKCDLEQDRVIQREQGMVRASGFLWLSFEWLSLTILKRNSRTS